MTVLMPASGRTPATPEPQPTAAAPTAPDAPIDLRGVDPATGRLATWRLAPIADSASGEWTVERAEGFITHPAVWMQAARTSRVVGRDEALALVAAVRG